MNVLDQHERIHPTPVPNIGSDLVEKAAALSADSVPVERVLAALELLRHGEITIEQAVTFSGQSREQIARLMQALNKVA